MWCSHTHMQVSPFWLMSFVIGNPTFLYMYAHFLQARKIYKEDGGKTAWACVCVCVCVRMACKTSWKHYSESPYSIPCPFFSFFFPSSHSSSGLCFPTVFVYMCEFIHTTWIDDNTLVTVQAKPWKPQNFYARKTDSSYPYWKPICSNSGIFLCKTFFHSWGETEMR